MSKLAVITPVIHALTKYMVLLFMQNLTNLTISFCIVHHSPFQHLRSIVIMRSVLSIFVAFIAFILCVSSQNLDSVPPSVREVVRQIDQRTNKQFFDYKSMIFDYYVWIINIYPFKMINIFQLLGIYTPSMISLSSDLVPLVLSSPTA